MQDIEKRWTVPFLGWGTYTILKTLAVLSFSNAGVGLIHILSDNSLFLTYTHNVGSTVTKIAVFQLINSFAVPLIAIGWGVLALRRGGENTEIGLWCDAPSCCMLPCLDLESSPATCRRPT